jgi:hypothetical protein
MKLKFVKYFKRILLKNKLSIFSSILARIQSLKYPKFSSGIEKIENNPTQKQITIIASSDGKPEFEQVKWGDYWVKHELSEEFRKLGYTINEVNPNIIIHLLGSPIKLPKNTFNIAWIYSHPDWINPSSLKQYDKIFCLSSSFAKKIKEWGFDAELMLGATNKIPPQDSDIKYDIIFIGNTRPSQNGRKIIGDLLPTPHNLKIWGKGWKEILPEKYYGGEYINYLSLNKLYGSSLITLNDHHQDMAREGFVSVRVFDILASGGFCISDENSGIKEIFGDTVPQYESSEHLKELINFYINNTEKRLELMEKGRKIALSHTWNNRAKQFLNVINNKNEIKKNH